MKNFIIFIAGMVVVTSLGCDNAGPSSRTIQSLSSPPYGGVVTLIGTIKIGLEVGLDCPDNFYLEDETGVVRVAQENNTEIIRSLGKKVEIQGRYEGTTCLEVCSCGNFISVEDVTVLE
ncbi:MAG: hypothetical protein HYV03_03530 [Deltaproteobacteria bacterium]|nr:hypothetical protein [Deltaproteobacteria bacterium]